MNNNNLGSKTSLCSNVEKKKKEKEYLQSGELCRSSRPRSENKS